MVRRSVAAEIVLAVLAAGCTRGVSTIRKFPPSPPNPNSSVFDLPVDELRTRSVEAFSSEHQWKEPIFPETERAYSGEDEVSYRNRFSVETAETALFSGQLLESAANEKDLYLHNFSEPIWPSPVYRGRDGGLPFVASFHLHLDDGGDGKTLVTVRALGCQVVNGMQWGIGPCGPGYAWRSEAVEPTSVEEYTILRYLGSALGRSDLPEVILPR